MSERIDYERMNPILEFYRGTGGDGQFRNIEEIWAFDTQHLEYSHDYIQYIFPLPEPSKAQPSAPVLTGADIAQFKADPELRKRVKKSMRVMLEFYERTTHWRVKSDHNHLRITRILRFLTLIGMEKEAKGFHQWFVVKGGPKISPRSKEYWKDALKSSPAFPQGPV